MSGPLPNVPISNEGLRELEIWLAGRQTEKVEHWIHVGTWGTDADTNQHSPPFQNSWTNATGKQRMRFGRRKRERGVKVNQLVIEGEVTGGADGTTVFTLPASYRPLETAHALGSSDDSVSLWRIETTGAVVFLGALSCTPAGGGFIQFDVDNEGGYLTVTSNDPSPTDSVLGFPVGISLVDASSNGVLLRVGDAFLFVAPTGYVNASGTGFAVLSSVSNTSLAQIDDSVTDFYLQPSGKLRVFGSGGGSNLLEIDESGTMSTSDTTIVDLEASSEFLVFAGNTGFVLIPSQLAAQLASAAEFVLKNSSLATLFSVNDDSSTVHNLAAGKTLVVNDGSSNPIFTLTG